MKTITGGRMELTSFKAYDVRGKVPAALNEDLARQIGVAYVHETGARNVVIGHDARLLRNGRNLPCVLCL